MGATSLRCVCSYYAELDVHPVLLALDKFQDGYDEMGLYNVFNNFVSLAQMSFYYTIRNSTGSESFYQPTEEVFLKLRETLTGG